ncbi:hypothetical protein TNCV_3461611 [Trichonephila clavipes]|nr:hypothetical protein TNCV_3461611 [Trichonephila clavipes]
MLLDVSMCLILWSNKCAVSLNQIMCLEDMFNVNLESYNRFLAFPARRRRNAAVPQFVADNFGIQKQVSPLLRCEDTF